MVKISDITLKGTLWADLDNKMSIIFNDKPKYDLFIICASIGIMYDQQIEKLEGADVDERTVPRTVLHNNRGFIELLFQSAVVTTTMLELSEDERLKLAFDDDEKDFKELEFLLKFANFGAVKLSEKIGTSTLETMDNLNNYFVSIIEDLNLDLNPLTDEDFNFDDSDLN